MLHLFFANTLAALDDALIAALPTPSSTLATLQPLHVLIPDHALEPHLKRLLALHLGVAANLQIDTPETWLARHDHPSLNAPDAWMAPLLAILQDPLLLAEPVLAPLRNYLDIPGHASARERRALQLATQLSHLFHAYQHHRPHLLEGWQRAHHTLTQTPWADTERWQAWLWQRLLSFTPAYPVIPPPAHALFAFALNTPSRRLRQRLIEHATQHPVHLFALAPCFEFYEDLPSQSEHPEMLFLLPRRPTQTDPSTPGPLIPGTHTSEPPLLRRWGQPAREHVHLWYTLSAAHRTVDTHFVDTRTTSPSLLQQLQHDILWREPERHLNSRRLQMAADASLRILACPTPQREAEAIACEIWTLLLDSQHDDDPIQLHDIAVLVHDAAKDTYFTRLQSVFAEAYHLPHTLIDLNPSRVSRFLEAVELLLELPFSRFGRTELLALLTHPNTLSNDDSTLSPDQWRHWCEQLEILQGADRHDLATTYLEHDLFNWDQGLRRLVLGAFMDDPGDDNDTRRHITLDGFPYLPYPVTHDQVDAAAQLLALVRSLIADARFARQHALTLTDWSCFFIAMVSQYLVTVQPEDERLRDACLEALFELRHADHDARPIPFPTAQTLARRHLARIELSRGQHLVGGVAIAAFRPHRPLPCRVMIVAGLNEGTFPNPTLPDAMDLRLAERAPGDLTPRERDLHALLETLLCARDRLILSYIARDPRTGEAQAPSSPLRLLIDTLREGYVRPQDHPRLVVEHALHRFDTRYFPQLDPEHPVPPVPTPLPEAFREAQASALRRHLALTRPDHIDPSGADPRALITLADAPLRPQLSDQLRLPSMPPRTPPTARPDHIDLPIAALRQFLLSPLQGAARFVLGLRNTPQADERLANELERFENPTMDVVRLLRDTFLDTLNQGGTLHPKALRERYRQQVNVMTWRGRHPTGIFAASQEARDMAVLDAWVRHAHQLKLASSAPFGRVRVGASTLKPPFVHTLEPLLVPLTNTPQGALEIALHGTTELMDAHANDAILLTPRNVASPRDWLRSFIDHVLLAATELCANTTRRVLVIGTQTRRAHTLTFEPITPQDARTLLSTLLYDMFAHPHDYRLPFEAIWEAHTRGDPVDKHVRRLAQQTFQHTSDDFGPVRRLHHYPCAEHADALVDKRLGLLLAHVPRRRGRR